MMLDNMKCYTVKFIIMLEAACINSFGCKFEAKNVVFTYIISYLAVLFPVCCYYTDCILPEEFALLQVRTCCT